MQRNTWGGVAVLLAAVLLFGCSAKKQDVDAVPTPEFVDPSVVVTDDPMQPAEPTAQISNPVHDVLDYNALLTAVPEVLMADAPSGATDVFYSYIDGTPMISQIIFTLDGNEYTYRGAAVAQDAQTDIAGVYDTLDKSAAMVAPDVDGLLGGEYMLKYATGSSVGVASWYYEPTGAQYTVYTPTGCDVSQGIVSVVKQVMPIAAYAIEATEPSGSVTGATVVSTDDGELIINTADGSTLQFELTPLMAQNIISGDVVDVSYYGELTEWPVVLSIEKSAAVAAAAAPAANQISGTVYSYTDSSVYVSTDSGMVYGFVVDKKTQFSGESTVLKTGNTVTITYEGTDLDANVTALSVETTVVASGKDQKAGAQKKSTSGSTDSGSASLENKRLKGYVTYVNGSSISIRTGAGHEFSFRINSLTSVYGHYTLGVGSKVRVVYDGYASDSPAAKKIEIYSDPDTKPQPTRHTMEGYFMYYGGSSIRIDTASGNQHEFAVTSATVIIGGGVAGTPVRITYTGSEDGNKTATKIVFG